jgi:hypothetical protein
MCKDGKCQENASKSRPVVVSLGCAARDLAVLTGRPQMVLQMDGYLAIGDADPDLASLPGLPVIISADTTTTDEEIERKADDFIIGRSRTRASSIAELIAALVGGPRPVSDLPTDHHKRQSIPIVTDQFTLGV